MPTTHHTKALVVGSGPAGCTAAIYAARANLEPIMVRGLQPGGQLTITTDVENYPGFAETIQGPWLMEQMEAQAKNVGTVIIEDTIEAADLSKRPFTLVGDSGDTYTCDTLIICTGASARWLGLESEQKYRGQGVSACATCDGFFYKGQDVAVVGGGDTAAEEATYLAGICNKVYLIIRKNYMRASKVMQERVANTPNIEILFEHNTKEIIGNEMGVNGAILINSKGEEVKIDISGFFLAIGHHPNSEIFKDYLETDDVGYILTEPGTSKTNIEGVFACGDVQDPHYRQAITAAGSGCMAAIDAERFLVLQE